MNDTELQLTQMLRTAAPGPPTEISPASLRAAQEIMLPALMTEAAPRTKSRRWLPLVSAGAVAASVVGLVTVVALAGNHGQSNAPAGSGGLSPAASTSSAPQAVTTTGPTPIATASTSYAGEPAVPVVPKTGPENGYQTTYAEQPSGTTSAPSSTIRTTPASP